MDDVVMVQIPVSREVAKALGDKSRREKVGKLMTDILRPTAPQSDPLAILIADLKAEAKAGGLTDADIDSELSAYNAERRFRR